MRGGGRDFAKSIHQTKGRGPRVAVALAVSAEREESLPSFRQSKLSATGQASERPDRPAYRRRWTVPRFSMRWLLNSEALEDAVFRTAFFVVSVSDVTTAADAAEVVVAVATSSATIGSVTTGSVTTGSAATGVSVTGAAAATAVASVGVVAVAAMVLPASGVPCPRNALSIKK